MRISDWSSDVCASDLETARHPREWLLEQCHAHGIPAGPIHEIDQVFADPQVIARGMKLDLGGLPTVRSPFTFSDAELALDAPSPMLGEHQGDWKIGRAHV